MSDHAGANTSTKPFEYTSTLVDGVKLIQNTVKIAHDGLFRRTSPTYSSSVDNPSAWMMILSNGKYSLSN